jgi:hypothetical protein
MGLRERRQEVQTPCRLRSVLLGKLCRFCFGNLRVLSVIGWTHTTVSQGAQFRSVAQEPNTFAWLRNGWIQVNTVKEPSSFTLECSSAGAL